MMRFGLALKSADHSNQKLNNYLNHQVHYTEGNYSNLLKAEYARVLYFRDSTLWKNDWILSGQ